MNTSTGALNHGDSIQVELLAIENYPAGPRKHLVFAVKGTTKTIEHVFMENGTNPLQAKKIWSESLARQLGDEAPSVDAEVPSVKYLIYKEGLTEAEARKRVEKAEKQASPNYDKFFEKLIGKEFTLWYKVNQQNADIYRNYVPYQILTSNEQTTLPFNT